MADNTVVPSSLADCAAKLPVNAHPHVMRFRQFMLLANPEQNISSRKEPEYLILQQHQAPGRSGPMLDQLVKPMARHFGSEVVAGRLPLPDDEDSAIAVPETAGVGVARIRALAAELRIPGYRATLSETSARALVDNWAGDLKRERFLAALEPLERAGFTFHEEVASDLRDLSAVWTRVLTKVLLPTPYQPFKNPHPHYALCATFEQVWEPKGYTRGELINTISLAPGEQLTLEVHSWDKSTFKSEEELVY